MKTRAALPGLILAVVFAVSVSPTLAAEPTLGARLSPTNLIYERDQAVNVTSLATIPVNVRLEADGAGWVLEVTDFALAPGERRTVAVTAAGEADTIIRATLTPVAVPPGQDAASLVLQTGARHLTWWERLDVPWGLVVLLVLAAVAGIMAVHRRRRMRQVEAGQGLAEYALILGLIAIVAIVALLFMGGQVSAILSTIGNSV